jgi:2-methylfumaryl-CoA hydratase
MTFNFPLSSQQELAPCVPVDLDCVRRPQYGRYLEEFVPGQVFQHPRGVTVTSGLAHSFARTFMEMNPIYLNTEYARAHGFAASPASPQLVFNLVLSLGVQNDSEKAAANLGYYDAHFLRPVYPGDTLRSMTRVVSRKERGGQPGIVHVQTLGMNQYDEVVLQYERKIMVPPQGDRPAAAAAPAHEVPFPWQEAPAAELPRAADAFPRPLTGSSSYFEDFTAGEIVVHANGRTITDEHVGWTYAVGNTHPLHYDRIYSKGLSGPMSGEPIVYGGLVFAWLQGLASRDVSENALWELGFTEGYHTQPAFAGDTVSALSRVLALEEAPPGLSAGIVTMQLVGVKNVSAAEALSRFGADLFFKENDKKKAGKEKIPEKVFEIERRLLIKKRPL